MKKIIMHDYRYYKDTTSGNQLSQSVTRMWNPGTTCAIIHLFHSENMYKVWCCLIMKASENVVHTFITLLFFLNALSSTKTLSANIVCVVILY